MAGTGTGGPRPGQVGPSVRPRYRAPAPMGYR